MGQRFLFFVHFHWEPLWAPSGPKKRPKEGKRDPAKAAHLILGMCWWGSVAHGHISRGNTLGYQVEIYGVRGCLCVCVSIGRSVGCDFA